MRIQIKECVLYKSRILSPGEILETEDEKILKFGTRLDPPEQEQKIEEPEQAEAEQAAAPVKRARRTRTKKAEA